MDLAAAVKKGGPRKGRVRLMFDDDVREAFNDAADRAAEARHLDESDPAREAAVAALEEASKAYDDALTTVDLQALPDEAYADLLAEHDGGEGDRRRPFLLALVEASVLLPDGVSFDDLHSICSNGQTEQLIEAAVNLNRGGDVVGKSDAVSALIRGIRRNSGTPPSAESAGRNGSSGRKTTGRTRSRGSSKKT